MKLTKRQLRQLIKLNLNESILDQSEKQKILSLLDSIVFSDRVWKKGEDNFGNPLPGGGRGHAQTAYELLSSLGDPEEWIGDIIQGTGDDDTRDVRWKDISRITWLLNFLAQDKGMQDRGWQVSSGYYGVGLRFDVPYRNERSMNVTIPKLRGLESLAGQSYPLDLTIEGKLIPWEQKMSFSIIGKLTIPHKYVKSSVGMWKEFPNATTYLEKKFEDWHIDIPPNIRKYVDSHVNDDGTRVYHKSGNIPLNLEMFFNFLDDAEKWINSGNIEPVTRELPGLYKKFPILKSEDISSDSLGQWKTVGGAEKFVASPNTEYERVEKGLPSKWDNIKLKY